MKPAVAAMVLASRGGARLERALASVAWADERLVLDPTGRLTEETLPAGVRRARAAADADAPWLLLLEEHEVVSPALAASVRAVATDHAPSPYCIPREAHARRAPTCAGAHPSARAGARVGPDATAPSRARPPATPADSDARHRARRLVRARGRRARRRRDDARGAALRRASGRRSGAPWRPRPARAWRPRACSPLLAPRTPGVLAAYWEICLREPGRWTGRRVTDAVKLPEATACAGRPCAPSSGTPVPTLGPWLLAPPSAARQRGLASGRGAAYRTALPDGTRAVVRIARRGGLVESFVRETYVGLIPRPLRELVVTAEARRRGVAAAEVLGVRVEGRVVYRGAVVTAEVPSARTLVDALRGAPDARGRRSRSRRTRGRRVARRGRLARRPNLTNIVVHPGPVPRWRPRLTARALPAPLSTAPAGGTSGVSPARSRSSIRGRSCRS
jgi:hypothetical protein